MALPKFVACGENETNYRKECSWIIIVKYCAKYAILYNIMINKSINYTEHITTNPEIMGGKPVIKGTRIPVETVLHHLSRELDTKTLLEDYPRLTNDDIKACLAYAKGHS